MSDQKEVGNFFERLKGSKDVKQFQLKVKIIDYVDPNKVIVNIKSLPSIASEYSKTMTMYSMKQIDEEVSQFDSNEYNDMQINYLEKPKIDIIDSIVLPEKVYL